MVGNENEFKMKISRVFIMCVVWCDHMPSKTKNINTPQYMLLKSHFSARKM